MSRRCVTLLTVTILIALTLVTRLPSALGDALWEDEVGALHAITRPSVAGSLRQIVTHESTPPAYYVLARTLDRATGWLSVEWRIHVLRGLSILFGLGSTTLTFLIARRLLELWAAVLAAFLASFASVLVVHGSELRAYPLLTLIAVAFAFQLPRAVVKPTAGQLAWLLVIVGLGTLTHYFFLLTLGAGVFWLAIERPVRSARRRVGVALLLGLIPLAAWLPAWFHQFRHGIFATAPPFTLDRFAEVVSTLLWPQALVTDTGSIARWAVTVAILALAVLLLREQEGRFVALLVLVPLLSTGFVAWTTGERILNVRNLIAVAPFAAVAIAWGCAALPRRDLSYGAGVVASALIVAGYAYSELRLGRTPYDQVARELRAQGFQNDEPIVWFGNDAGVETVAWYLTQGSMSTWPRYVSARPRQAGCRAVQVVVRTRAGREWLRDRRDSVLDEALVESYGDAIQGRRGEDIVVARLRWAAGILAFPRHVRNTFIFHVAGGQPPCLLS